MCYSGDIDYVTRKSSLVDIRVIHNGYFNTYLFTKDGKKITLSLLASHQLPKHKPQKNPEWTNLLLTLVEPTLKGYQYEFKPFKEWILQSTSDPDMNQSLNTNVKVLLIQFEHTCSRGNTT